jgi:hypothetical protein
MNKGLELFVNDTTLSASSAVSIWFSYKFRVIIAPTGKPEVKPITSTRELHPGRLKRGRITGSSNSPSTLTKRSLTNNSAATKKGKSAGKTVEYHKWNPKEEAATVSRGFININTVNITITAVKK